MIPTRFIDEPEYLALLDLEETPLTIIHALDAMYFNPPREEEDTPLSVIHDHVHVLFLNAVVPCIYPDKNSGVTYVILPKHDDITYESLQEIHPAKGAWAYRLSPHNWSDVDWINHELQYSDYWFAPEEDVSFTLEDWSTH